MKLYTNLNNKFFFIDSNNYTSCESSLFGYFVNQEGIFTQDNCRQFEQVDHNTSGSFISITRTNDKVTIKQDIFGSMGLYIFTHENYFAISNSFYLLLEKICNNYQLSINQDYLNCFLINDLCSMSISDTLINEISVLKNDEYIEIYDGKALIKRINFNYNSIPVDSESGIKILDNWWNKWIGIINNLYSNTHNISCDLSGGFDTRMVLALLLNSKINLNEILIYSNNDGLHTHSEDFDIASSIAKDFKFTLNNRSSISTKHIKVDNMEAIVHSSLLKLGFHKEMYIKKQILCKPRYCLTGANGESVRCYPNKTVEEYQQNYLNAANKLNYSDCKKVSPSIKKLWEKDISYLSTTYNIDKHDIALTTTFYNFVRAKNHYGKANIESFGANMIMLTPLMDPQLLLLKKNPDSCKDGTLLMTLIFNRYCPKLLEYPIEGGRSFSTEAINYSLELCKRYPLKLSVSNQSNNIFTVAPDIAKQELDDNTNHLIDDVEFFRSIYKTYAVNNYFINYYSMNTYLDIFAKGCGVKFYPTRHLLTAIALAKVQYDINCFGTSTSLSFIDFYNKMIHERKNLYTDIYPQIVKYMTARIDIKCAKDIRWELQTISENATILFPNWSNQEKIAVITSSDLSLKLRIKVFNSGKLYLMLRGLDIRNTKQEKIPYWIDYESLIINKTRILSQPTPCWHNQFFNYEIKANENDIIDIYISWAIHKDDRLSIENNNLNF